MVKVIVRELYKIVFPNGKLYFGMSFSGQRRFLGHIKSALKDKSKLPVHNALRKYGAENCKVVVLCVGTAEYIGALEQRAIAAFKTRDIRFGYNVCIGGEVGPMTGRGHTKKSRKKMSKSQSERERTSGEIENMRYYANHKVFTPEYRAALSVAMKKRHAEGRVTAGSPAQLAALRRNAPKGPLRQSTKDKISAALIGRPNPGGKYERTPEIRAQTSAAHKAIHAAGCVRSSAQDEAVKKRQRAGTDALRGKPAWNRGRSHSETTLQRISVAVKAHHAYKRELKKCGKIPETHPAHKFGSGSSAGLLF